MKTDSDVLRRGKDWTATGHQRMQDLDKGLTTVRHVLWHPSFHFISRAPSFALISALFVYQLASRGRGLSIRRNCRKAQVHSRNKTESRVQLLAVWTYGAWMATGQYSTDTVWPLFIHLVENNGLLL
ncbi:hypothetical protein LSTR_LSTR000231 [Laodelphax striatellus]|uniref:Uncharacterized protein n=1 Tax=Laodelphax striatellus TaxID=195883 RepID=A0A482X6W8_LAOST|nr:hypothetical protein LSTR_LSTR000231 [Laodelphax striatellus]